MAVPSERLQQVIAEQPKWYFDPEFMLLYRQFFSEDAAEVGEFEAEKWELIGWFAQALMHGLIKLESVSDGYNDDDRQGAYGGASAAKVDTVVVHHTSSQRELTVWELEAVSLLRLYVPHFMQGLGNSFVKFLLQMHPDIDPAEVAPASGHYELRDGKEVQSFVGYHFMIHPDGRVEQLLKLDYMAFHAGNYAVNARSIGVAFAGDLSDVPPTAAAQAAFKQLLHDLAHKTGMEISYLMGHSQVRLGHTVCPGSWFTEFLSEPELSEFKNEYQ